MRRLPSRLPARAPAASAGARARPGCAASSSSSTLAQLHRAPLVVHLLVEQAARARPRWPPRRRRRRAPAAAPAPRRAARSRRARAPAATAPRALPVGRPLVEHFLPRAHRAHRRRGACRRRCGRTASTADARAAALTSASARSIAIAASAHAPRSSYSRASTVLRLDVALVELDHPLQPIDRRRQIAARLVQRHQPVQHRDAAPPASPPRPRASRARPPASSGDLAVLLERRISSRCSASRSPGSSSRICSQAHSSPRRRRSRSS